MTESDEALVRQAKAGDAEAFGELVRRHQPAVTGFLLSVLRDLDSAEDASQHAFVKAYQALGSFRGGSSFRTWVSRIGLNLARSQLRWARLRSWLSLEALATDEDENWEDRLRAVAGPSEREALERRLEWERAMATLPRREREVTALRLEGYALAEIAEVLGIGVGTVKSTLFDATRKLRERLG